jgi:hypothetical protein
MFALQDQTQYDQQPQPRRRRTITLETQWYDDQYDDNGVDVNALGDDDGYVEPLEQTDDFGESAYEYTYHPQDDQEQQQPRRVSRRNA